MIELDADRRLALTYVPSRRRAAIEALWRLDLALASVVSVGREPLISQIRLTWWREALERLDGQRAPAEPVLQGLERWVLPSVSGAELAAMEAGWTALLAPEQLGRREIDAYASGRGRLLFRYSARLLGGGSEELEQAGESWSLIDLARNSANAADAKTARAAVLERRHPVRWPSSARPLGMLYVLARRDAERGGEEWEEHGSPGRMLRMLGHRLTGR